MNNCLHDEATYDDAFDFDLASYEKVTFDDFETPNGAWKFAETMPADLREKWWGANPWRTVDAAAILAHLEWLVEPARKLYPNAMVEIAWDRARDGNPTAAGVFPITKEGLAEAVKTATRVNGEGCNIYVSMVLKKPGTWRRKRTKLRDCLVGTAIPCDIDKDAEPTSAALKAVAEPGLTVRTGTTPQLRKQEWCRLTEPCADPVLVEKAFRGFVEHVGGDTDAQGAYRLMRLAGGVSYPSAKKQARGYVVEQTTLTINPEAAPVDIQTFATLPPKDKPKQEKAEGAKGEASAASSAAVNISFADFRAAVMAIKNDDEVNLDRHEWLKIGMAIRHQLGGGEERNVAAER